MEEVIIKAEKLCYSYDNDNRNALNQLTLEIKKGEKVAVMGANGSGKSTFFLCCNGINRPSSGVLYFHGQPIEYSKKGLLNLRSKIGIVFQDPDIQLFSASVYQEISFGILNMGVDEETARGKVEQVIRELEITPFRQQPTHALSVGQKKQVSIADILVMNPEVMILDEPTAALDPKHTTMVKRLINQVSEQGTTVMMAIHDVDYALQWADTVLLFHEGMLLKAGNPLEVFEDVALLQQCNLEQPMVIQIFKRLQKKGILDSTIEQPRSMQELTQCIEECG